MRAFAVVLAWSLPALAAAPSWRVDEAESKVELEVLKRGALGHDHLFRPDEWKARIAYEKGHPETLDVDVEVQAASMHDHQPNLSAKDEEEVDRTAHGPEVLDAAKYPTIRFSGHRLTVERRDDATLTGTVDGELTLHGVTRPLRLSVVLDEAPHRVKASGTAHIRQSEFGMKPYAKFLGAVAVRDEVVVRFTLVAQPER